MRDYENVKLVNLSSCTAAQLPLILSKISQNSDLGVGGNVKVFLQKLILYSWTQNSPLWTRKLSANYLHSNQIDIRNGFEIWTNLCRKIAPRENPEKQAKNTNFLIATSYYQRYTKFTSRYMFLRITNTMKLVKISVHITKDVKIQDGRH